VVEDDQHVIIVIFLEQVPIHERLARAHFDLDLVALLPLHVSFSHEDFCADVLEITVELLALIEVLGRLVVARVIIEVVSINTLSRIDRLRILLILIVVILLEERDSCLNCGVAIRVVAEIGLLLQRFDLFVIGGFSR